MANSLVSYSRAGDVFHYRWAARRCLKLLYPDTGLNHIVIEGSTEKEKAGEYVIDLSEYFKEEGSNSVEYYQLKHTTVQGVKPFKLSDLEDTLTGFAGRYRQHERNVKKERLSIGFNIITNRKVDDTVKDRFIELAMGEQVDKRFLNTLEKYTKLKGRKLAEFCALVNIDDGEGNYQSQNIELKTELAQLLAGTINNDQVRSVANLVQEKVLPDSDHIISKEEVLKQFDITNSRQLFPAPPLWEKMDRVIQRHQHAELIRQINQSENSAIVHAAGGVGKTVFCRQLVNSIPAYSLGIAYDCFGTGSYRNRATQRHRYRDALVQIANELSTKGLCPPLIVFDTTLDDDILRSFLDRINTAATALRKTNNRALLYIMIDAADNAEMAAAQFGDPCFAHELLRENMPKGCRLIMLCRPERKSLLNPGSQILDLPLAPFTEAESLNNLRSYFPDATPIDGLEFHRLTDCNPRVQANALSVSYNSVTALLASFGPTVTTVEMQIHAQLVSAVSKITDAQTPNFQESIKSICVGLASLPPHIPIDILASAARVSRDEIKSFVADMGRPLWISDSSVQFRDEPTETWFRDTYLAQKEDYISYIQRLEPLAATSTYVAEVLPQLYLEAGEYEKLIRIALSDELLPENAPIDARNVRIFRLRFAFIAALKSVKTKDAVKLGMRAGEEVSGSNRQFYLFRNNPDLLTALQEKEKVQEIAYKTKLRSGWDGSENVYTASLLSGIESFIGEARGFLRAAENWLSIYFKNKKRDKKEDHYHNEEKLTKHDLLEFAYAHLNIHGVASSVAFINHITPKEYMFKVVMLLAHRLIDAGKSDLLNEYARYWKNEPYYIVAIAHELLAVGKFLNKEITANCLKKMCGVKTRIKKPEHYFFDDMTITASVNFIETCVHNQLPDHLISLALDYYAPKRASHSMKSQFSSRERTLFLKALSIRMAIAGKTEVTIEDIIPTDLAKSKAKYDRDNEIREYKEFVDGLLPWYLLRLSVLKGDDKIIGTLLGTAIKDAENAKRGRYRRYDVVPKEISTVLVDTLVLQDCNSVEEVYRFLESSERDFSIDSRLELLRAAYRCEHLSGIRDGLEASTYSEIQSVTEQGPDEISDKYISLARAVAVESKADAAIYFNHAVDIVSKFGEELVKRWEALQSLAEQASKSGNITDELAYRYIRCAELVGRYVAREKHWGRNSAVSVAAKLSDSTALAAISRWRDRDVGSYQYQLLVVIQDLIKAGSIPATWGWALSHFFDSRLDNGFAKLCIERAQTKKDKQLILDDAVRVLETEGALPQYTRDLNEAATTDNLPNDRLKRVVAFQGYEASAESENDYSPSYLKKRNVQRDPALDGIFSGVDILSHAGLNKLFERLKGVELKAEFGRYGYGSRDLGLEAMARIQSRQVVAFLDIVLVSDHFDVYDVKAILYAVPEAWKIKPAFQANWPRIIQSLGRQNAHELINEYTFDNAVKTLQLNDDLIGYLKKGIHEGLQNVHGLGDGTTFFGFCELSAPMLLLEEAVELTDYSLQRFEIHMEYDLGDGRYRDEIRVEPNIIKSISGFIWSALGSPRGWVRWNAAHAVRKMAELGCSEIIDSLFEWMKLETVGAFGAPDYIFYKLHAKQYLLIAIARISGSHADMLVKHSKQIAQSALDIPHIIIQKLGREIALNIEAAFPGTYDETTLNEIRPIGITAFETVTVDHNYSTQSPWHEDGELDDSNMFNFSYDFDRYWFDPLGNVFGISGHQVKDLATEVVVNEWGMGDLSGYQSDPRVGLWNKSSFEKETWHDRTSYPKTDRLDFYISYHAMMAVAAKLIAKMPVVRQDDWYDNPWTEWLSDHLLTIPDGRWLSDIRDPLPLKRPSWVEKETNKAWKDEIAEEDFRNALISNHDDGLWITVRGGWHEKSKQAKESVTIISAFVAKDTSDALLRALQTCSDPHDFKLPNYRESDMEFDENKFVLKGWIEERSGSKFLDEFDPESAEVSFPLFSIGEKIIEELDLIQLYNIWCTVGSTTERLRCTNWSGNNKDRDDYPDQVGISLQCNAAYLQEVCRKLDCDLIIEVTIERDLISSRMGGSNDYGKPVNKILIFSEDGTLRTTDGSFRVG